MIRDDYFKKLGIWACPSYFPNLPSAALPSAAHARPTTALHFYTRPSSGLRLSTSGPQVLGTGTKLAACGPSDTHLSLSAAFCSGPSFNGNNTFSSTQLSKKSASSPPIIPSAKVGFFPPWFHGLLHSHLHYFYGYSSIFMYFFNSHF